MTYYAYSSSEFIAFFLIKILSDKVEFCFLLIFHVTVSQIEHFSWKTHGLKGIKQLKLKCDFYKLFYLMVQTYVLKK